MRAYGYTMTNDVIETEAEIIRSVATRLVLGESLRSITADLNRNGVQTSSGKLWTTSTVRQMMVNPRLGGDDDRGIPAILSPTTRKQIVELFVGRRRGVGRPERHLLSGGILRCGHCDAGLIYRPTVLPSYHCVENAPYGGCGKIRVSAEPAEAEVAARALARIAQPDSAEIIARMVRQQAEIAIRLNQVTQRLQKAIDAGKPESHIERLRQGESLFRDELVRIATIAAHFDTASNTDPAHLAQWWDETPMPRRRLLLDLLIETIRVRPATRRGRVAGGGIDPERLIVLWR